jgi:hypothetical protein
MKKKIMNIINLNFTSLFWVNPKWEEINVYLCPNLKLSPAPVYILRSTMLIAMINDVSHSVDPCQEICYFSTALHLLALLVEVEVEKA